MAASCFVSLLSPVKWMPWAGHVSFVHSNICWLDGLKHLVRSLKGNFMKPKLLGRFLVLIAFFMLVSQASVQAKSVDAVRMPVFYVTDRQREGGNSNPTYNSKRRYADGVEYGQCEITTPSSAVAKDCFKLGWRAQKLNNDKATADPVKSECREPSVFFEDVSSRLKNSDRVIVFVHGYNNSMDVAMERAAELGLKFKAPVISYCWPSNEKLKAYIKDECNAEWSLVHFRKFLSELEKAVGAERIIIVSHSMGNRLVMWALNARAELSDARQVAVPKYADIVMTSPDIDSGTFKNYSENVCRNANRSWVLLSRRDKALMASKFVHGRNRLGAATEDNVDVDWRQPPVVNGLKTIEFTSLDKGFVGHSVRADLIFRLVKSGVTDVDGEPIKLVEEKADNYSWYRVLSDKEKKISR